MEKKKLRVWHVREHLVRVHPLHHLHHLLVQPPLCLIARLLSRHLGLQQRYTIIFVLQLSRKYFWINKGRWCRRRRNRPGATTQTDQTSLLLWNRLNRK